MNHDDDDQPATAETIIHALSQFGPGEGDNASDSLHHYSTLLSDQAPTEGSNIGQHDLGGLSRSQLEAEVLKLRGLVYQESVSRGIVEVEESSINGVSTSSAKRIRTVKAKEKATAVNAHTGKRVERGRRTELYKAIRHTMRFAMDMEHESDPLPAPRLAESSTSEHLTWAVPDWQAAVGDEANHRWIDSIAQELFERFNTETNLYPKVDHLDQDLSTIQEAVKVTFANYVKRYKSENDVTHTERKARYAKNRRRWARKDLKQEKRSKARNNLDPSSPYIDLPQEALMFDYQSSEHSSSGSDSPDSDEEYNTFKMQKRKIEWENMRNAEAGPSGSASVVVEGLDPPGLERKAYGWGMGLKAKILEVRTPSWRSEQLNQYYAHLDSLSESHAQARNTPKLQSDRGKTRPKAGHVAPSHRRFTLPVDVRRKGNIPRALTNSAGNRSRKRRKGDKAVSSTEVGKEGITSLGDDASQEEMGWMWASGKVGVWPTRSFAHDKDQ